MNMRLLSRVPLPVFSLVMMLIFASRIAKQSLFGHANHAAGEVKALFDDLKEIADRTGFQTPEMDILKSHIASAVKTEQGNYIPPPSL
jgi:hypothetical protein